MHLLHHLLLHLLWAAAVAAPSRHLQHVELQQVLLAPASELRDEATHARAVAAEHRRLEARLSSQQEHRRATWLLCGPTRHRGTHWYKELNASVPFEVRVVHSSRTNELGTCAIALASAADMESAMRGAGSATSHAFPLPRALKARGLVHYYYDDDDQRKEPGGVPVGLNADASVTTASADPLLRSERGGLLVHLWSSSRHDTDAHVRGWLMALRAGRHGGEGDGEGGGDGKEEEEGILRHHKALAARRALVR